MRAGLEQQRSPSPPAPLPEVEGRKSPADEAVVVEARDLSKTYILGRMRVRALRNVSLRITRGEIVAIIGPSGCGKTTLLHCLSGLEDFPSGEVLLEGRNLARLSDAEKAAHRARRVGFVFQSYNLLPVLNALENVELPLLLAGRSATEARRRALRALEVVGLENRLRHRPSELSGGQQQRVAIARALAPEPAVIFADEPTGNLDTDSADEIMQLIVQLNRDNAQTFVLVTHAREVAAVAHRIVRMRDGEIEGVLLHPERSEGVLPHPERSEGVLPHPERSEGSTNATVDPSARGLASG